MIDLNATLPLLEPWASTITNLMETLSVLIGGFFGLYVIILIYRIFTFRKLSKQMEKLFKEINDVKKSVARLERKGKKKK